ncbi:MAG: carboxypeptidase-like regulatory domain-containing protein [Ignavibacteria bacterium]
MYRYIVFLFIVLFFSSHLILSQNLGTIRGTVSDSLNGEVLAYGNVLVKELSIGTSTDNRGFFIISSVPANHEYTLTVTYVGYEKKDIIVKVLPDKITHVDIKLSSSSLELQTVEKIGQKVAEENATDIGLERISVRQLEYLPKGVEMDVFRSLQYMPGVRSTGDVSARYYVRGGSSNQNLVLLDGVPIYNPFHALGMFSAVDPDVINNIEFYKGGFPAEYNGRISSIMDLIAKDGNKNSYSGKINVSQLTGKVLVEGPIPHGSFIFTGRKSLSKEILKKFLNNQSLPIEFYDASVKLTYANPDILPISKFSLHAFISDDDLDRDDPTKEAFGWSNKLIGFSWFQADKESPLFYEIVFSYSNFEGEVIPNLSDVKQRENSLDDITLDMNFNYIFNSKDEIALGIKIKDLSTDLFVENAYGVLSNINESSSSISAFIKYKLLRFDNFGLDIGSRFNLVHLSKAATSEHFFEPRISITYGLFSWMKLQAASGVYLQELTTLSDERELISFFEPWIITPDYLKPAKSIHLIGGTEISFSENASFSIEGYYKISKDVPTVNDEKYYETDPDLVGGELESYGWEFLLNMYQAPFNFTASYSLSWAYKEVDEWVYYPRYDSRHNVNLGFEVDLGNGWQASAVWVYNTGLPFTETMGFYDKFQFDELYTPGQIYEFYEPFRILRDINLGRLPDYHRLDLNLSKKFQLGFLRFSIDASIINVYDRKNIFYFDRETGERVNMLPFLPTARLKVEI